ncbi:hypothetical protein AAFF_G00095490 [Aldrovandia affinis]|uniref:SET domain-containing protein n=1 Tax=Aldrovandia affinis TaxID=143900 RepID=A0AAD7R185_9TELE|nr:hypothetical protein AAFF_G00095490 [Aldrovandia affinis]
MVATCSSERLSCTPGGPSRARLTLPLGLEVRVSGIPGAGLGVFNRDQRLPVGVHFGPYEGELTDEDEAIDSGYSWRTVRSVTPSSLMNVRCMAPHLYLRLSCTPGGPSRARLTLPLGLEVRVSGIPGAGLGVFNRDQRLPVGCTWTLRGRADR